MSFDADAYIQQMIHLVNSMEVNPEFAGALQDPCLPNPEPELIEVCTQDNPAPKFVGVFEKAYRWEHPDLYRGNLLHTNQFLYVCKHCGKEVKVNQEDLDNALDKYDYIQGLYRDYPPKV